MSRHEFATGTHYATTLLTHPLPPDVRSVPSLEQFKNYVNAPLTYTTPYYYNCIPRPTAVILSQMRVGFSNLNYHLYSKNCVESPACSCGCRNETVQHYFFHCPNHSLQRQRLMNDLSQITPDINIIDKDYILNGINNEIQSVEIFGAVHRFIATSKKIQGILSCLFKIFHID